MKTGIIRCETCDAPLDASRPAQEIRGKYYCYQHMKIVEPEYIPTQHKCPYCNGFGCNMCDWFGIK